MKRILIAIACLNICACLHAQGITLLYKNNLGWNDPLSWIQINTPQGQTPIQRVPTVDDDVVISFSMSGIFSVNFGTDDTNPNTDFNIGGDGPGGPARCRSMHISNTQISFDNALLVDGAPTVNVYTSSGGFVIIDSGSNMLHGHFQLHGGNPAITDLQILHSTYGVLFSHADWTGIGWDAAARLRLVSSKLGGYVFAGNSGGNVFIDSCTIETHLFMLGDNSTATLTNSTVTNNINNNYLTFFIGKNSDFVSANDTVFTFSYLAFTTSGSQLNGNVGSEGGGIDFLQEDPANPLPNILNGDLSTRELNSSMGISGDLKISGNLSGFSDDIINNPVPVLVNGTRVFDMAGVTNYQNSAFINNCVQNFCHYKLEFFGSTNSTISWNGGFPIDTLVINKTNCAKVTCDSSLYVSGATKILAGQLALNPDDHPYKFVCAGNVDIAPGGGLFLRRNAAGIPANMAVGGTLVDHNPVPDSTCEGLSNPYGGTITFYSPLPLTLLEFKGRYTGKEITLNWSTEAEINTKYFTIEKSIDQVSFHALTNINAAGTTLAHNYGYTDKSPLSGINYYRLKMVDIDGRFTYSRIIAVKAPASNSIAIFPNPVSDKLFIKLGDVAAATRIFITDAKGIVIKQLQLRAGTWQTTINIAGPTSRYVRHHIPIREIKKYPTIYEGVISYRCRLLMAARISSSSFSLVWRLARSALSLLIFLFWSSRLLPAFLASFASRTDLLASRFARLASFTLPLVASDALSVALIAVLWASAVALSAFLV